MFNHLNKNYNQEAALLNINETSTQIIICTHIVVQSQYFYSYNCKYTLV